MSSFPPTGSPAAQTSTSHSGPPGGPKPRGWRGWDVGLRATVIGTIAGVLSLVVAIAAWQWPRSPSDPTGASAPTSAARPALSSTPSGSLPTATAADPAAVEYLDGPGFPAESGGAYLVSVPRAVRDDQDYSTHPIAITCPSNETGDQVHDVTYLLQGRYIRFDADVRPYYPPSADARSATYVTALMGKRQRDNALTITEAGKQQRATPSTPQPFSATIEDAEKLTLRVECGDPNGTIILTNARLTPA